MHFGDSVGKVFLCHVVQRNIIGCWVPSFSLLDAKLSCICISGKNKDDRINANALHVTAKIQRLYS